jgi:Flp pilus assembly pilin Flp
MTRFARFLHDESGATAIECGIVAAGISAAIIIIVNAPGRGDFHQHQVRGNHRAA